MLRDPEFGPVRLRAFGSYCVRVDDPAAFIRQIAGTDTHFQTDEITGQLRNILVSRFADALAESKIPMLDLAANYNEMGDLMRGNLQPEFDEYGTALTKFLIENVSLPAEVEETLDKRTKMGLVGNLNQYTQFQTAEAIEAMAANPSGGSGAIGMIAGVGMGNVVGGVMQGATQSPQAAAPAAGPPPLPDAVQWYAGINNEQAGPFSPEQLQQMIAQGQIDRETLVWKQGMAGWEKAGQVADLEGFFGAVPPPLPTG